MACRCSNVFLMVALFALAPAIGLATTIYDVQHNETSQGSGDDCYPSPLKGQTVTISGVVTAVLTGQYPDFWMQESGDQQWRGVFVYDNSVSPSVGDSLTITAKPDEYFGLTEMKTVTSFTVHASGAALPSPVDITTGDLGGGCNVHGEAYEGVLVRLRNVTVTQGADSHGEWYVDDGSGECQVDDYMFHYDPTVGQSFDAIVGLVHWSYGEYELNPRSAGDIVEEISGPPTIDNTGHDPASPLYTEPVKVTSQVTDDGTVSSVTLYYSTNGGTSWNPVTMSDNGVAPDQTAGDNIYSSQIGAQPAGTAVKYYIQAVDNEELESFDPTTAPASTYSYTVSGGPSGDGTGTATIAPDSVGLSQTVSVTVTILGDGTNTLAAVAVVVPENWSWSQNASDIELGGQGFSGAAFEVIGDSIFVTGAEITDVHEGQIVIADLASPGSNTTSTFVVQTAIAGGHLEEIASSPQVVVGAAGPEITPIADIQADPNEYIGETVTVRGVVTIGAGILATGWLSAYMQDESGRGINLYQSGDPGWAVDKLFRNSEVDSGCNLVEVTGEVAEYLATGAISATTEIKDITAVTVLDTNQPLPDPVILSTEAANDPEWDGTWVQITGIMQEDPYFTNPDLGDCNLTLDDGSGSITIRIWGSTGIDVSEFSEGDIVTARGVGSVYKTTYQILVGYQEDIWEGSPPRPPAISDTDHQPASPLYTESVRVTSHVTDDGTVSSVTLYYSTTGGSSWNFVAMFDNGTAPDQTAGDDIYTAQIGAQAEGTVVKYYIKAVDDEALQSFDPSNAPTGSYSYTVRSLPGDGSGTATISPDSVGLSQAVTETLTVAGDGTHALASVAIIVPKSWGWTASVSSVSLAGAGFSGATRTVSGDTIAIGSAALTNVNTGHVIVTSLTSPGTAATSTFTVKTAVAGGALTEIASSPRVTVSSGGPEYTHIADIQANPEVYIDSVVTVRAVVTIGADIVATGWTSAFIQDGSGRGINVYGGRDEDGALSKLLRGNLVEVAGKVEEYLKPGYISPTTEITDFRITVLDTNQPLPDPIILSTGAANDPEWDGTWIQVTGVMLEDPYYAGGGYNLNLDDNSGKITVRIWDSTEIDSVEEKYAEGETHTVRGVGSAYTGYQILVGYEKDIDPEEDEGIGYATISPATVKAMAQDVTEAITIWSDEVNTLTDLSIDIPNSWAWNDQEVQLSGTGFPQGTTVEVTGERNIRIRSAAVTEADQGVVTILNLNAPEVGEVSVFRVKTASAGQSLKEISSSPRVTVQGLDKAKLSIEPRILVPNRHSYTDTEGFTIKFNVPTNSRVILRLYDVEGRVVRTLVDEEQYAGPGQVVWNGRDELREVVPIGVYICYLEATDREKGKTTADQAPIVVGTPLD